MLGSVKQAGRVVLCAVLVHAMLVPTRGVVAEALAQASPAPGTLLPGFGGASATPRMLVIMDTSKSMRFYPDNTGQSNVDFAPVTGSVTTNTFNAAENSNLNISCPSGRIASVIAAVYGRTTENGLSAATISTPTDNTTGCNVGSSTPQGGSVRGWLDVSNTVRLACLNQASCTVSVDNTTLLGDPCNGRGKDAWVQVTCDVDPCPPSSGSKFCLAKKALYSAVKTQQATGLLEMAAGGYAQFDYYNYHDPVNSTYATTCRYDTVLTPGGYTSGLAGWTTTELDGAARAASPSLGSDSNYVSYSCQPQNEAIFNSLSPATGNIFNSCAAGQLAKTCYKYWNRTGISQEKFQNPSPACKTTAPTGGAPWVWAGGCQPAGTADQAFVNVIAGSPSSDWYPVDLTVPSASFGGSCTNAPTWYTDVTNPVSGASVGGSPAPGSTLPAGANLSGSAPADCAGGKGPCAYTLASTTGSPVALRTTTVYNTSVGPATLATPVTINGQTYNVGPTAQGAQVIVLPGGPACTATLAYTGTPPANIAWSNSVTAPYNGTFNVSSFNGSASTGQDCSPAQNGAGGCALTALSPTATTLYVCPAGYTGSMANPTTNPALTCTQTRYMHETSGVSGAAASPGVYSGWTGVGTGSWQPFTYSIDLVTYGTALAGGTDLCGSPSTTVNWTSSAFPASGAGITQATGLPCGASNNPANGGSGPTSASTSVCNIKQGAATELKTDLGLAVCHGVYYAEAYWRTANPGKADACAYSVTPERYEFDQEVCSYKRFHFAWDQVQFAYRWTSNDGDYGGSFDQSVAYPLTVPAAKQYCGGIEMRVPNADVTEPYAESGTSNTGGFSYPAFTMPASTASCPAQLAAGTGGCPASAKFCKLRWSSGGRFANVVPAPAPFSLGSTPAYLDVGNFDRRGCALADPAPHDPLVRSVLPTWTDWCSTTSEIPFTSGYYDAAPRRMADFYTPNAAYSNAARGGWPALWGTSGSNNPFASYMGHTQGNLDRFCAADESASPVCTTSFPSGPFPAAKASGLSLEPTTLAGGTTTAVTTSYNVGMTFSRWKRGLSCSTSADCLSISGSTCAAGACTDPTWVDHSLDLFSKYDAALNPWGLRMPDEGDITPLAGSLTNALSYIAKTRADDSQSTCRKYSVLLVTDGYEEPATFGGVANDPVAAVTALKAAGVDVYVVGFGISGGVLDQMAQAAGTAVDAAGHFSATGSAYNASNFSALQSAINSIIGAQLSGTYTRSKPTISSTGDRLYSAYFAVDSSKPQEFLGFLDAFPVTAGAVSATPAWKFDQVLNTVTAPGSRTLYTRVRGAGSLSNFDLGPSCTLVDEMCSDSSSCAGGPCSAANKSYVDSVIEFVRNDRSGPQAGNYTDGSLRLTRIADVFYSQPVPVPAPNGSPLYASLSSVPVPNNDNYPRTDTAAAPGFDGNAFNVAYTHFKAANASRETQVFVHSNDGVLHSVRESTAGPAWLGREHWGYVPRQTQPLLYTRMAGHRFLADGSFAEADVCFGRSDCEHADGSKWMSLLVGSLGRGGPYLYGLDITDPTAPVWQFDINPDSLNYPHNLAEPGLGLATSAPVISRVMVGTDPYKWGVFAGGGYWDSSRDGAANNDCHDDSGSIGHPEQENGNWFYVFDADPANVVNKSALPLHQNSPSRDARWCVPGVNYLGAGTNVPNNSVPGRPGVLRPNGNARATTVYFGDTDGKLNRMDVTSRDMTDWTPGIWFNPYKHNSASVNHFSTAAGADPGGSCTLTGGKVWPMPNILGSPPDRTIPLAKPSLSEGLAPIWQRPYRYPNENTSRDVLYVGTGDPMNPNGAASNRQNYFYAIEEQTGVSTHCPSLLRWSYYLDDGSKVLSDPAVVGQNIIVGVYVPPGGTGGCGSAGYSLLFCFDRLSGAPKNCLGGGATPGVHDDPSPQVTGTAGAYKWIEAGAGMVSDLTVVGNSVVFTTSVNPGKPKQMSVQNVAVPFKVRSWRRLR